MSGRILITVPRSCSLHKSSSTARRYRKSAVLSCTPAKLLEELLHSGYPADSNHSCLSTTSLSARLRPNYMKKDGSAVLGPSPTWSGCSVLLIAALLGLSTCADHRERTVRQSLVSPAATDERTSLDEYVQESDPNYFHRVVRTITRQDYTAHVLEMASQVWSPSTQVSPALWKHWLTVIEPENISSTRALLYITGGSNDEPPPEETSPALSQIAIATHSVVAELRMVPNQPLAFIGDEFAPRLEDSLIAYAWDKFLKSGEPNWLPRLPMTKSAIQAMDTVVDFLGSRSGAAREIDGFVVAGASKRGWTTWTTAAVDPRIVAIVPIVTDLLNLEASFKHHFASYGFWGKALRDYVEMGIPDWIGTKEMRALTKVVDPYEYRSRLTMPKFMINASGDEFFLPDSSEFYFDDLPGEKYLRYVPNTGHSLQNTDAIDSLLAYYEAITTETPRPQFTWTFADDGSIHVQIDRLTQPSQVLLWQASNSEARDFRFSTIGDAWTQSELSDQGEGFYVATVAEPTAGWSAFFVELTYPSGRTTPLKFTTQVRIVPDALPFSFDDLQPR